jgi:hypothetical protein
LGYGCNNFQSGCPTTFASSAMLSILGGLRPFSTSLSHDCAKPVRSVIACCVSPAAFRARRKFRAKTRRSSDIGRFKSLESLVSMFVVVLLIPIQRHILNQ